MISVNGIKIESYLTMFPDGTSQVWKLPPEALINSSVVTWLFEHESELIHLAQLRSLLPVTATLWMPYLPYGRQDKRVDNELTFALMPFAILLNAIAFNRIKSFDPHSEMAKTHINWLSDVSPDGIIQNIFKDFDCLCFPDAGAANRYSKLKGTKILGHKIRNQSTGKIESYSLDLPSDIKLGSKVLVVDDICDGGATFLPLGQALKELELKASLYVSHGIFSKGLDELKKYYDNIITTDSRPAKYDELIVHHLPIPF